MILTLQRKVIVLRFWTWYYTGAVRNLMKIWRDFIIFVQEYYSISLLLRTLFAPWKRDITQRPRGLNIGKLLEVFAFNLISRSIGFVVRSFTVLLGLISLLIVIILGFVALIVWLVLPILLIFFIIVGLLLLLLG